MVQILESKGIDMKKLYNITVATSLAFVMSGCLGIGSSITPMSSTKVDVKDVCNVQKHGIENVLDTAKAYNAVAKKKGVEFRRLNVNNSDLIVSVEEALKTGAKQVNPVHFKSKPNKIKKSKTKLKTDYAAWRACSFAIRALQQVHEAESTWRSAVPGDGFKY
jgi:hypothetical protein